MNKEEILKISRQENKGKPDECETAAFGKASRIGMLVGAALCVLIILAGEFIFNAPEIGLVCWLVYFSMQGSSNIVLYMHLKNRSKLIYAIIEIICAIIFAVSVVLRFAV